MNERIYKIGITISALVFLWVFLFVSVPAVFELEGDLLSNIVAGFQGGYVNPFATGYSVDATACWFILLFWVWYEAKEKQVRHGWLCLLIGAFPGIAIGFAAYLFVRQNQVIEQPNDQNIQS